MRGRLPGSHRHTGRRTKHRPFMTAIVAASALVVSALVAMAASRTGVSESQVTTSAGANLQAPAPMRVYGSVQVGGGRAAAGAAVVAVIGSATCGTAQVSATGAYVVDVVSAAARPGCGTDGATVNFTVGGARATQTITWRPGVFVELDLNTQQATPTPPPPTPRPTPTVLPATPTPTPRVPTPSSPTSSDLFEDWYRVAYVVDGNTVMLESGRSVRLYGVDAPAPGDWCGRDAVDALYRLLTDNGRDYWVLIEYPWSGYGASRVDDSGRVLAYLKLADATGWYLLDEQMAYYGYAYAGRRDGQYFENVRNAEGGAWWNQHGCLWA